MTSPDGLNPGEAWLNDLVTTVSSTSDELAFYQRTAAGYDEIVKHLDVEAPDLCMKAICNFEQKTGKDRGLLLCTNDRMGKCAKKLSANHNSSLINSMEFNDKISQFWTPGLTKNAYHTTLINGKVHFKGRWLVENYNRTFGPSCMKATATA